MKVETEESSRAAARMENLRGTGMYDEVFTKVDELRQLQDRASRGEVTPEERQHLDDERRQLTELQRQREAGTPMSGTDQVALDYYKQQFQPELEQERRAAAEKEGQMAPAAVDQGLARLEELRRKKGFEMGADDKLELAELESKYGEIEKQRAAERATAEEEDRQLAEHAAQANRRLEQAAEAARTATQTAREANPTSPAIEPAYDQSDLDAVRDYNNLINPLRQRANGFGEPLSVVEQARLARLEAAYATPAPEPAPEAPAIEPTPEPTPEPAPEAAPEAEVTAPAAEAPKSFDEIMALGDDEFFNYLESLDTDGQAALFEGLEEDQALRLFDRVASAQAPGTEPSPAPAEPTPAPEAPPDMTPILNKVDSGEPLTPEEQAAYDAWQQRHAEVIRQGQEPAPEPTVPSAPEAAPDMTPILNKVDSGEALTPEEQAAYDAWRARHADVIEPGQVTTPEAPVAPVEVAPEPDIDNPTLVERLRGMGRNLRESIGNGLRNAVNNPGEAVRNIGRGLRDVTRAWWAGVMPVDFFRGEPARSPRELFTRNYWRRWQGLNVMFYGLGVAGGTVIDIVSVFPGAGALRPAVRGALGLALPMAMGASEAARLAEIDNSDLSVEEKARKKAETKEKFGRASGFIQNIAHGVAAGMVASSLVEAAGVDKWVRDLFKAPEGGEMGRAAEAITGKAVESDIVFKAVEGRGYWGADFSALGDAAKNWDMAAGTGSNKTEILGWILRQNADTFGAPGDTFSYADLGENSKRVIDLLRTSPTWQSFVDSGGRHLINQINAGAR